MNDEQLIKEVRASIRERAKMPPDEWFRELVRDGVIDKDGNVLLRMPKPPKFFNDQLNGVAAAKPANSAKTTRPAKRKTRVRKK